MLELMNQSLSSHCDDLAMMDSTDRIRKMSLVFHVFDRHKDVRTVCRKLSLM